MLAIILSITGLFRFLVSLLFFYLLIRLITRWIQMSSANNQQQSQPRRKREEGEMVLRFNKKGERIKDSNDGEYIDYEEVD